MFTQLQFLPPSAGVAITQYNYITKKVMESSIECTGLHVICMLALLPLMSLLGGHALLVESALGTVTRVVYGCTDLNDQHQIRSSH